MVFGEVLFDVFPDGASVLGGAPFNVAWHLEALGLRPLLISRVGDDVLGRSVMDRMSQWGMDLSGIQVDRRYPTGQVNVAYEEGHPRFTIPADQAYDYIEEHPLGALMDGHPTSLLYHGCLALRAEGSRDALRSLVLDPAPPVFLDVNLRTPWWDRTFARELLGSATWAKLSLDELQELATDPSDVEDDPNRIARELRRGLGLEAVLVTMGADGALIETRDESLREAPPPASVVDTVGAGDAFSAAYILGLHRGWGERERLSRALSFSSRIVELRGATPGDASVYSDLLA